MKVLVSSWALLSLVSTPLAKEALDKRTPHRQKTRFQICRPFGLGVEDDDGLIQLPIEVSLR